MGSLTKKDAVKNESVVGQDRATLNPGANRKMFKALVNTGATGDGLPPPPLFGKPKAEK